MVNYGRHGKLETVEKFGKLDQYITGCKWFSLNALIHPLSHFLPLLLPSFLSPQYKEMVYYGRMSKRWKFYGTKSA